MHMVTNKKIKFKNPLLIAEWLDTALEKEKEKLEKCPVNPDMVAGYVNAQGWGYVVTGYFLIESALKAILFVHGLPKVPMIHSLSRLFGLLKESDKDALREYYDDYRATTGGTLASYPHDTIDGFLVNLDGIKDVPDNHVGSFEWRYFLIQEQRDDEMPMVSVDCMHEIVYGCVKMLEMRECGGQIDPTRFTRSWRLHEQRARKHADWQDKRMNSNGYANLCDRLEILWGPDHLGRHDLHLFQSNVMERCFSELPSDLAVPVIDKRKEVESFIARTSMR